MTAERAEGLISPWKVFLVIVTLFLLFSKHTFYSELSSCRFGFRVEMVLWHVLC